MLFLSTIFYGTNMLSHTCYHFEKNVVQGCGRLRNQQDVDLEPADAAAHTKNSELIWQKSETISESKQRTARNRTHNF